jgi:AraC family transcriptional regulator
LAKDSAAGSRAMCQNAQFLVMYFTQLPDHSIPGFDEQAHFNRFKKQNIIFNAFSRRSHCPNHVGCLSLKTTLTGEEWYGVDNHNVAVRPGQFLVLNNDQSYSCQIHEGDGARVLSVFFEKDFAAAVFHDMLHNEEHLLEGGACDNKVPEFFQTLHQVDELLRRKLAGLVGQLEIEGYDRCGTDEHLVFLLRYLVITHKKETRLKDRVSAIKASTKSEILRRLCVAKDILHSDFQEPLDLDALGKAACLSTPQLIRQFKTVFNQTPYQYLVAIRLQHAAKKLRTSDMLVSELAWRCGFNDPSAFGRAFRKSYGIPPERYRAAVKLNTECADSNKEHSTRNPNWLIVR